MSRWKVLGVALFAASVCAVLALARPAQASGKTRTLTVAAASSLTEFMEDAKPIFEKAHPGVELAVTLAGSSVLRMQIEGGAPVDVFMSADQENMDTLKAEHFVKRPQVFAHNKLAILVSRHCQKRIQSLADLATPGLSLVVGTPTVPIGKYTQQVLKKADRSGKYGKGFSRRVMANVISQEPNVKLTAVKILLGEADAAITYITDITAEMQKSATMVTIPEEVNVIATYPIGVVESSRSKDLARAFVDFVMSKQGQELLKKRGFMP